MDERDRWSRRDALRDLDRGWVITADLLSATGVWAGIGWFLDRWLGTSPWLLVVGVLLGFSLGTYLVFKRHEQVARREEARRARL